MKEEEYRKWDTILKVVAPIITVLGLLLGVAQFTREQANLRNREIQMLARNDAIEFKRRVWERQLSSYVDVARLAGEIAVDANQSSIPKQDVARFEKIYWGILTLFDDPPVTQQLIKFRLEVHDFQHGLSSGERVKLRANDLEEALRVSIHTSWSSLSAENPK